MTANPDLRNAIVMAVRQLHWLQATDAELADEVLALVADHALTVGATVTVHDGGTRRTGTVKRDGNLTGPLVVELAPADPRPVTP